jgi:site-specific recombinase XerC
VTVLGPPETGSRSRCFGVCPVLGRWGLPSKWTERVASDQPGATVRSLHPARSREDMGVIRRRFGGRWVVVLGLWVVVLFGAGEGVFMSWSPCLNRSVSSGGRVQVRLGHEVVDGYLEFLAARCRPNTGLAAGFDLMVFFTLVAKDPVEVTTADVLTFITEQRSVGDPKVIRLSDGESGLSSLTIKRRLSSPSSMFSYLLVRGDIDRNPVPQGLSTRRSRRCGGRGVPLIRTPRTLTRIVDPAEVDLLLAACRRLRDRAMFEAMVLGGLRRCEVLGLRLEDLDAAHRQVLIVEGKGGHQRRIPISARWFSTVGDYLLRAPRRGCQQGRSGCPRSPGRPAARSLHSKARGRPRSTGVAARMASSPGVKMLPIRTGYPRRACSAGRRRIRRRS